MLHSHSTRQVCSTVENWLPDITPTSTLFVMHCGAWWSNNSRNPTECWLLSARVGSNYSATSSSGGQPGRSVQILRRPGGAGGPVIDFLGQELPDHPQPRALCRPSSWRLPHASAPTKSKDKPVSRRTLIDRSECPTACLDCPASRAAN